MSPVDRPSLICAALLAVAVATPARAASWMTTVDLQEPVDNASGIVRVVYLWSTPKTEGVVTAADLVGLTERYYGWVDSTLNEASAASRSDGKVLAIVYEAQSIRDGAVVDDERAVTNPKFRFDLDTGALTDYGWSNFANTTGTHHALTKELGGNDPVIWTRGGVSDFATEIATRWDSAPLVASNFEGLDIAVLEIAQNEIWATCLTVPTEFEVESVYFASRFDPVFQRDLVAQVFIGGAQGPGAFLRSLDIPDSPLEAFNPTTFSPLTLTPGTEYCFALGRNSLAGGGLRLHLTDATNPRNEGPGFFTESWSSTGGGWTRESDANPTVRRPKLELRGSRVGGSGIVVSDVRTELGNASTDLVVQNLTNGSGLTNDGLHDSETGQWRSQAMTPGTLTFELDARSRISAVDIWNYNGAPGGFLSQGVGSFEVLHSERGQSWASVGTYALQQASGTPAEPAQRVNLPDFGAGLVRFHLLSSQFAETDVVGLSEVQFVPEPGGLWSHGAALAILALLRPAHCRARGRLGRGPTRAGTDTM